MNHSHVTLVGAGETVPAEALQIPGQLRACDTGIGRVPGRPSAWAVATDVQHDDSRFDLEGRLKAWAGPQGWRVIVRPT